MTTTRTGIGAAGRFDGLAILCECAKRDGKCAIGHFGPCTYPAKAIYMPRWPASLWHRIFFRRQIYGAAVSLCHGCLGRIGEGDVVSGW